MLLLSLEAGTNTGTEKLIVPVDPTVADELSCLSIGEVGLEVFRCLQNEALRPGLGKVLSYEADIGGGTFATGLSLETCFPAANAFNITSGCLVIGRITMTASTSGLALMEFWGSAPWYTDISTVHRPRVNFTNAARSLEVFSETEAAKPEMRVGMIMRLVGGNESMSDLTFLLKDTNTQDSDRDHGGWVHR